MAAEKSWVFLKVNDCRHTHPVSAGQNLIHGGIHSCQFHFSLCLLLYFCSRSSPFWLQAVETVTSQHRSLDWAAQPNPCLMSQFKYTVVASPKGWCTALTERALWVHWKCCDRVHARLKALTFCSVHTTEHKTQPSKRLHCQGHSYQRCHPSALPRLSYLNYHLCPVTATWQIWTPLLLQVPTKQSFHKAIKFFTCSSANKWKSSFTRIALEAWKQS